MSESDMEFVERMKREWDGDNVPCVEDFDRLIALARRGAAMQWRPISDDYEGEVVLWPRGSDNPTHFMPLPEPPAHTDDKRAHSAFANSENADDPECTCCGGTGISYQTERRCACQPLPPPPKGVENE